LIGVWLRFQAIINVCEKICTVSKELSFTACNMQYIVTCIVLAVVTEATSPHAIVIREGINARVIVTSCSMAITITGFTREGIVTGPILPWLVIVEWQTLFTGRALGIVLTRTHRVQVRATEIRVTIASTPIELIHYGPGIDEHEFYICIYVNIRQVILVS